MQYFRSGRELLRSRRKYYRAHIEPWVNIRFKGNQPILIYTMGKVGSSSIHSTLHNAGRYPAVYHVHTMHPPNQKIGAERLRTRGLPLPLHVLQAETLRRLVILPQRPVKIITGVRDPISRNLSAYFENLRIWIGDKPAQKSLTVSEYVQAFSDFMSSDEGHNWLDVAINWFDEEFRPTLGIDVYAHPFSPEAGYGRITTDHQDVLIYRLETPDEVIISALREFLNNPSLELVRSNVGEAKDYSAVYREFKDQIVLPQAFINRMVDSQYMQHFYTAEERDRIRTRWMKRLQKQES